jgi:hypothetical protein
MQKSKIKQKPHLISLRDTAINLFLIIIVVVGVHCDIYKSSYNIS